MYEVLSGVVRSSLETVIASIITLLIGFTVAVLAKKIILRLFQKSAPLFYRINILNPGLWLSRIASWAIYGVTLFLVFEQLGVRSLIASVLWILIILLVLLSVVVGVKDTLLNLLGRVLLFKNKKVRSGKYIAVQSISGKIEKIGALETTMITDKKDRLYIPNQLFLKKEV